MPYRDPMGKDYITTMIPQKKQKLRPYFLGGGSQGGVYTLQFP